MIIEQKDLDKAFDFKNPIDRTIHIELMSELIRTHKTLITLFDGWNSPVAQQILRIEDLVKRAKESL